MKYTRREEKCTYTRLTLELGLVTQVMGAFPVTAPGCQDRDLSKNSVEVKGAFRKGKTSQEFPTWKLMGNQHKLASLQKWRFSSLNTAQPSSPAAQTWLHGQLGAHPQWSLCLTSQEFYCSGKRLQCWERRRRAECRGMLHLLPRGPFPFRFCRYLVGICFISSFNLLLTAPENLASRKGGGPI